MPSCIYCKVSKSFSDSHIIPEALGKGPILSDSVCKGCNNAINKEVERSIISELALLRNLLKLEGKRKKAPAFTGVAKFKNFSTKITLRKPKDLDERLFVFSKGQEPSNSKSKIVFIGLPEEVDRRKRLYEAKHPQVKWENIPPSEIQNIPIEFCLDFGVFGTQKALRLASKIAFEWWCKQRNTRLVAGSEYDPIRNFIKWGRFNKEPPLACVVTDNTILKGLDNITLGNHSILIDISNYRVIAIVGIFGLVYYKVTLTKRYPLFTHQQCLTTVNSQSGQVYEPPFRRKLRDFILTKQNRFEDDPMEAIRMQSEVVRCKLNDGLKKHLQRK